jgi:hypothetical protein
LTTYNGAVVDFSKYATPILGYPGGNGSNPVDELGCAGLLIVSDFSQSESNKINIDNDYRQFALLRNIELYEPIYKIYYNQSGVAGTYAGGETLTQVSTGAVGIVTQWKEGLSGQTGTSEIFVTRTSATGDFTIGVTGLDVYNYTTYDVRKETLAGREGRRLVQLKLVPAGTTGNVFDPSGLDYTRQHLAMGIGSTADNISASNTTGIVYSWQPDAATNLIGSLYLEYTQGNFKLGEYVIQGTKDRTGFETPKGKIVDILEAEVGNASVYDQITNLAISNDGVHTFPTSYYTLDSRVSCLSGSTKVAAGDVVDWSYASGSTGNLYLTNTSGIFSVGNTIAYTDGVNTYNGVINTVVGLPDVRYRTGEVVHVQNIRPIERSIEQREEIKFLVEF